LDVPVPQSRLPPFCWRLLVAAAAAAAAAARRMWRGAPLLCGGAVGAAVAAAVDVVKLGPHLFTCHKLTDARSKDRLLEDVIDGGP
jgi:cysteine synthase